jgi:phosphoserine phosphatase
MSILCLIANPNEPRFDVKLAAAIARETGGELDWLHHGIACDIANPSEPDPAAIAREMLGSAPVDVAVIANASRRKKLLIADMDSTMIEQECIDELADAVGIKAQIAAITERAMRGELDFEAALDTRVRLLKGLSRKAIEEVRREKITMMPGGRALVQTMKAYGAYTALISGGFTYFADFFAKRIGFDEATANTLEFDGDILTGTVTKPIVDKSTKLHRLLALSKERSLWPDETLAVGDGANDLDMLQAAGLGVAYRAKPALAAAAKARIEYGDLTALLYLQGYRDDEIVR